MLRNSVPSWYSEPLDSINWVNTEAPDGVPHRLFVSDAAQEIDLRPFVEGAAGTEASRDA